MTQTLNGLLRGGLDELSIAGAPASIGQLVALARLVAAWGRRINLSGHRTPEAIAARLVLDAAALWSALPDTPRSLVDLGSGAGFPGLPIAIIDPTISVTLVESRERRYHFQRHAIRELGLSNVQAIRGRYEELDPVAGEAVIAQGVAAPSQLIPAMLRWALPGAVLAVPGGTVQRDALDAESLLKTENLTYKVPQGGSTRTVWVGRAR